MKDLTDEIMQRLREKETVTSEELADGTGDYDFSLTNLHGVLLSLASKGKVSFDIEEKVERTLTEEGEEAVEHGSQEYRLFGEIGPNGSDVSILKEYPHGAKHAFKNRWIRMEGERVLKNAETVADSLVEKLQKLTVISEKEFNELKRRNLAEVVRRKIYVISKGPEFEAENGVFSELTAEMVSSFRNQTFKKYNFDSTGNIPAGGSLHPLMKIKEEIKKIFLEMGFEEMATNRYVESGFWNFDSLFQPQNHPARDAHDTFFLSEPEKTVTVDEEYLSRVRDTHVNGGFGSTGHGGCWSRKESMKNILRTHTTAISARYLKEMRNGFKPVKLFSIDKVFRNESVDATHLAEFHQIEGLIAGCGLGLSDLMGILKVFYNKLGISDVRFKPAFNPYTEPSMEVFGYHPGLRRWIEIGNSGIFRPEMLGPMGYDTDVSVIAWGLSLERPAMIKYGLNNIRDLVGHKVDINFIKNSSFVQF